MLDSDSGDLESGFGSVTQCLCHVNNSLNSCALVFATAKVDDNHLARLFRSKERNGCESALSIIKDTIIVGVN